MKAHVGISLDIDVAERLQKEANSSKLINDFLREHFKLNKK